MKKDILFLCQFFYPEYNSSATLPFDTARYLVQQGFTVDTLCGYPKEYSSEQGVSLRETVDGINIRRVRYIQLKRGRKIGRLLNYFSFTASAVLHLLRLRKYESVIVFSNPPILPIVAVLGNMLFKTKIVFVAYDVYPEVAFASNSLRPGSIIDRGMQWLNKKLFSRASRVVALTDEMRSFIIERRPQISPEKVVTIPNWAHENKVIADEKSYELFGYSGDEFIVSYFGNMGICQDMETLLGAAEKLKDHPNIKFLIIGHGSKKEYVEKALCNNPNADVYGFLTGDDFMDAIAVSTCCVVSLEKGIMGTCAPSKYYSYLQGGKPIIAVVEKGSYLQKEVEDEGIGYAVEIGDVDRLAQGILKMAENKEDLCEMKRRTAELYSKKYEKNISFKKYEELMRDVLGE